MTRATGRDAGHGLQGAGTMGILLVAASAMLWGTVGVASKGVYGLSDVEPMTVGFLRLALAAPVLLVMSVALVGRATFAFHGRERLLVLGIGVSMAFYQVFYFTAVSKAGVTIATLVTICAAPLLVAIMSSLFLKEALTAKVAVALALGISGTLMLVGFPSETGGADVETLAGVGWACGSALAYAVFVLLSRALAPNHHPATLIAVGFGSGALLLLPFAGAGLAWPETAEVAWLLLYIGMVPTALAYLLYFRGMRETPATVASIVTLMEPLTATVLAWVLFGERLGPVGLVGGGLLLASILILSRRRRR